MDFIKIADKDGAIMLSDTSGNRALFEFLEFVNIDNTEYAALVQIDTDDLVILSFKENDDGSEVYSTIDDDTVFDKVASVFESIFNED